MELHGKNAVGVLSTHSFDDAILGISINPKTRSRLLNGLMVHAVGLAFPSRR